MESADQIVEHHDLPRYKHGVLGRGLQLSSELKVSFFRLGISATGCLGEA